MRPGFAISSPRWIALPEGLTEDPPAARTVAGPARKNQAVHWLMNRRGCGVCEGSRRFLTVRAAGLATALVTSSEEPEVVPRDAGLERLFDAHADARVAARFGLRGQARAQRVPGGSGRLAVEPRGRAVFEDTLTGVEAGRAGGGGLVVVVERVGRLAELRANGADVVVDDLGELSAQ